MMPLCRTAQATMLGPKPSEEDVVGALEELTVDECRELLASRRVGRLALDTPGGLRIYPLNYSMQQDDIVFRTLPYGQVANNAVDAKVAFSVDQLDDDMRSGWHVLAVGTCRRIEAPDEVRLIRDEADPEPWVAGQRTLYFRIEWDDLTGRRLHVT
jgi:uncharacterized protein